MIHSAHHWALTGRMKRWLVTLGVALVGSGSLAGCRNNCDPKVEGCVGEDCRVVWDCGGEVREIQFHDEDSSCECTLNDVTSAGSCAADFCEVVAFQSLETEEGVGVPDTDLEQLDEVAASACGWSIHSTDTIVIGACFGPRSP